MSETETAWAKVGGDERGREGESLERAQRKGIRQEEKEGDLETLTSDVTAR